MNQIEKEKLETNTEDNKNFDLDLSSDDSIDETPNVLNLFICHNFFNYLALT